MEEAIEDAMECDEQLEDNLSDVYNPDGINPKGWSVSDKFEFLKALRASSSLDSFVIHEYLPMKSIQEIENVMELYLQQVEKLKPKVVIPEVPKPSTKNTTVPLTDWVKLLTDRFSLSELTTDIARAVRLIAEYEDFPYLPTTDTDFRKVYLTIANALEGKPLAEDKGVADMLSKCFHETALSSKALLKTTDVKKILSIESSKTEDLFSKQQSLDRRVQCLRSMADQKCYNPLNISERFLKCEKFV